MTTAPQLDVEKCREIAKLRKSEFLPNPENYGDSAADQLAAALTLLAEAREALLDGTTAFTDTKWATAIDSLLARIPDLSELRL